MYIYTNEAKLKKNKNIAKWTTIAAFVILIAGAVAAFSPQYITLSFIALIVGFIASQVSISFTSKWGREPTNDAIFNVKLKGLSDNFSIYHYMDPVDHLLVGTAGTFILMPYFQGGQIGWNEDKQRWTQKKANFLMKLFGQENLGRPDQECDANIAAVRDYFISRDIDFPEDKIHPILVFINPQSTILEGQNFKYDTIPLGQLKKTIANYAKVDRLDPAFIDEVTDKLPLDDIE
ncbi:MAG: hypothetical protein IKP86_11060 [Anaerolineaceae bacterium]|nr:hypothetical protein [Anaerolineaceae bacterium]